MPERYRERPYVPAKDPLAAIPPSRHPFQFWVMFALVLSGLGNFLSAGSQAVGDTVDPVHHKIWAATLFLGALAAIVGSFWRDRATGLLMERAGLVAIGVSCPVYAVIFVMQVGLEAGMGGFMAASVGVASLWRVVHVNRELRILNGFMRRTGMQ